MAPALNLPPPTHGVSDELRSKDGAAAAADAAPQFPSSGLIYPCLLYTSDAADE